MLDEMSLMTKNQGCELVDLLLEHKYIGNQWILKIKRQIDGSIAKYKTQFAVKDYT